jgi:ATP-dependent Clp endopeptidase proteolytic subunit ClpP
VTKKRIEDNEKDEKFPQFDPHHELTTRTYESLLKDRVILLNGEIKESVIEKVGVPLLNMSKAHPKTPITILINSEGGSADDGQAIVDIIQQLKTPVITIGLGKVMSAAFDIFLAGDMRIANPNTLFMCHAGYNGVFDRMPMINDVAALQKRYFERWARYYASKTNWSYDKWYELLDSGKDFHFFPEEAKKIGIVTDISSSEKGSISIIQTKSTRKKAKTKKSRKK